MVIASLYNGRGESGIGAQANSDARALVESSDRGTAWLSPYKTGMW